MMRNPEGYPDPTAGMALRNIEHKERAARLGYMPLTYICLPSDAARMTDEAKRYCTFALSKGVLPIVPCLLFPQAEKDDARERNLYMSLILLKYCQEVWYFGEVVDDDMRTVLRKTARRDMIVRRFTSDCKEADTYDLRADFQEAVL